MSAKIDPITRSVVQHRLSSIVKEMGEAMLRTSYSQILNSSRDFSLAITDTRGRLIAQAEHIPVHAARRSAGCCFIHSASCGAPTRQDCTERSAKSEVVTVCSWQLVGEERLQSTAMILITAGAPHRCDGHWRR